jgi:hypothetical protein
MAMLYSVIVLYKNIAVDQVEGGCNIRRIGVEGGPPTGCGLSTAASTDFFRVAAYRCVGTSWMCAAQ